MYNILFQVFVPAVAYDSQRYAAHEREQLESKQTGTTFVNTRDEMYLALVRFAGIMKRTAEQLEGTDSVCLLVLRFSLLAFLSCFPRVVIGFQRVYHIISVPSYYYTYTSVGTVTLDIPVLPCAISANMEDNVANPELMSVVEQTCNNWFFKLSQVCAYIHVHVCSPSGPCICSHVNKCSPVYAYSFLYWNELSTCVHGI